MNTNTDRQPVDVWKQKEVVERSRCIILMLAVEGNHDIRGYRKTIQRIKRQGRCPIGFVC